MFKRSLLGVVPGIMLSLMGYATPADSVMAVLDKTVAEKAKFAAWKEQQIAALRSSAIRLTPYDYNKAMYDAFRKFRLDSALFYVRTNFETVQHSGNKEQLQEAALQLASIYSFVGRYLEAEDLLNSVNVHQLPAGLVPVYYEARLRFFEHYSTSSKGHAGGYRSRAATYRDSLIAVIDTASSSCKLLLAERDIELGHPQIAEQNLLRLLPLLAEEHSEYAMAAYLLAKIYGKQKNQELEKLYYARSAIADLRNAVKDQASILNLALICYANGDIDRAYLYTRSVIEDALFSKLQFRTIQLSEFFSIINAAYQEREAARKSQLQVALWAISLLSCFLILAVVYVYKQMKKLSRMREELYEGSRKLTALNTEIVHANEQLRERNAQLSEANHVKEEYIAHFFDLCSSYINKLENYRKTLQQKATSRKMDELLDLLRSTSLVDDELDELYRNFDSIFLHLYPGFVQDFNRLLLPEEQVVLRSGELLNTELRIFALIRLGISDSVKIAAFLRYSLSTIYNYRTRTRNKAAVSRDEFESSIMKIGMQFTANT
ncbi:DUF6377 domain-containing protein [Filimonas effusa]|uniref:DUF6377 domain-containing protein n=1 Tax=Filimonas effusa TaxID=2508721 RepID=A0A4Q1DAT4_9BACT|nr:DUF6377 domain-containing protein [Filimonas effusa]RXK85673.1 hypothetical protein ESB13_02335 [Filimonas effusa]